MSTTCMLPDSPTTSGSTLHRHRRSKHVQPEDADRRFALVPAPRDGRSGTPKGPRGFSGIAGSVYGGRWSPGRKHRDESDVASGEVVVDAETGSYRERDVFDDSDVSSENDTDTVGYEDGDSTASQDEESVSDAESVMGSEQGDSTEETDSDQSGSESDTGTDVSSGTVSSDESECTGYDSGYHSGDEEEWTLYRDWSIALPHQPGDVLQRVIKQTKRIP
uniref:Uncharacterized protein n=1 Tax=Branchiostoma floridae TaxID=7739 RepID=C3YIJ8_BRAFL|eukprot:XP_002603920.1 hypothetical protein BRAFLDRAFT_105961 [Branchiostoma floridae]